MSISSTASSATCLLVATTLTTGCPSYVAVCWASAKCGMGGACGTGRKIPIGSVRVAMSLPTRISRTPSSSSAAAASMPRMRACGYGQRPTALAAAVQVALDRIDDELVASAAAQHPGDLRPDLVPGQRPAGACEGRRRHEEAGRAEATLQRVLTGEEFLQR